MKLKTIIENYKLIKKYPFLEIRPYRRRSLTDRYTSTWLDLIPQGWVIGFGKEFCESLKKILKKAHYLKKFRFLDIKEKYGTLRIDYSSIPSSIGEEIDKWEIYFEDLSMLTCIHCGDIAEYYTKGWISFVCSACAKKHPKKIIQHLTWNDIPVRKGSNRTYLSPLEEEMKEFWLENKEE